MAMKHKLWTLATGVVLSVLAVTGGVGCLMSGMLIEGNLALVAVVAMVTALVGGFCFQRRLSYVPVMFLGILGVLLWVLGPLNRSTEHLLWYISSLYDVGYGCGVLRWTQGSLLNASSTLALCYGASWLSLAVTRCVVKQKRNFLGAVAVLVPLLPCLVLTDTVPKTGYLFVVLLCFGILLLTQTVRDRNPAQANKLTLMLAGPIALLLGLLLLLCPRETYTGQVGAEKLEQWIASRFDVEVIKDAIPKPPVNLSVAADVSAKEVELTQVGPQNPGIQVTLQVQAEKTGTMYLRGSAYDCYDGSQWTISQGKWSRDGEFAPAAGRELTAKVITSEPHQVRYVTYTPAQTQELQNGRVENTDAAKEYTIRYAKPAGYQQSWQSLKQSLPADMQMYLALPQTTLEKAREHLRTSVGFLKEDPTAADMYRYATTVAALVRNSARYDLNTPTMPGDADDFAMWFLQKSETGYCVHYASATAVLLRAAGIPARYVSGYLVKTQANQPVNVRHKDAHAWVEYYIPGVGWMMVEATASGGDSPVVIEPSQEETTETTIQTQPEEETSETVQAATGEIQETAPKETAPQTKPEGDSWVGSLLLLPLGVALILGQWRVRVALRQQSKRRGKPNAQALCRWREAALCARLLGVKPDAQLYALALKARFSRETITPSELRLFEERLQENRKKLKEKPLWNQLVYTLILALY
jgi:hypothetical protein